VNAENDVESKVVALLDIGGNKTCISILQGMELYFTREIYMGGNDFTSYIAKKQGLELFESEQMKRSPGDEADKVADAIAPGIEEMGSEINLSLDYYENQYESKVEAIYLSGGGGRALGLDEAFEKIFERKTIYWSPVAGVGVDPDMVDSELLTENALSLGVAMGLASRIKG